MSVTPRQKLNAAFEQIIWWHNQYSAKAPIKLEDVLGKSTRRHISRARHDCMWLMRKRGYKLFQVGRLFGRDHTTVVFATDDARRAKKLVQHANWYARDKAASIARRAAMHQPRNVTEASL